MSQKSACFRTDGKALPTLVFLPEEGSGHLAVVAIPHGLPEIATAIGIARDACAVAAVLTAEAWVVTLHSPKAAALSVEDLPAPSESPERYEAIVTVAVHCDGTLHRRFSEITRTAFGAQLASVHVADGPIHPEGNASWMLQVLTGAQEPADG